MRSRGRRPSVARRFGWPARRASPAAASGADARPRAARSRAASVAVAAAIVWGAPWASTACFTSFDLPDVDAGDGGSSDGAPDVPSKDGPATDGVGDDGPTSPCKTFGCGEGLFCDFPDDLCGAGAPGAVCEKPQVVPCDPNQIVCGCDGKPYANACQANANGVDVDVKGQCVAPGDQFPCGSVVCRVKEEYCVRKLGGTAEADSCMPFPAPCLGDPSCTCLQKSGLCATCDTGANGGAECSFK